MQAPSDITLKYIAVERNIEAKRLRTLVSRVGDTCSRSALLHVELHKEPARY